MPLSHEHVGSKNLQKFKSVSSPEQNYLSLFAMRYPVACLAIARGRQPRLTLKAAHVAIITVAVLFGAA